MGEAETDSAAPADFDSLRAMIVARRQSLPKRLAQVAAYTLENPDDVAFGTAASVAASADVQPSTLVRFAQYFNLDGFSGLQQIFRDRLKERTASYEERLAQLDTETQGDSHEGTILEGFVSAASRSIERMSRNVDARNLDRAVEILAKAEMIYLVARRRSYPISSYMAYAFGKLRIRHTLVGSALGTDPENLDFATPRDAVLAISFSPYANETATYVRNLAERGIPVVSITDSAFSPLAEYAAAWFEVVEADFAGFRSLSATMALAMALTVAIAERRQKKR
ncbi:MAG: MurR/RpiR family transcriptional regulator [Rhizobiaceae bacterium]